MSEELPCSEHARAVGEPLAGTAVAEIDRWIVLEHDAAWGAKGLEDSGLPERVVTYLAGLSARFARLRIQLIRQPGAAASTCVRLYLAESGEGSQALSALQLDDSEALLALPLDGWLRGAAPLPGERLAEPLYLVCVHGKRDRCCARLGMPVYRALEAHVAGRVFQTTHLGGHRFAATLLVLPSGLCYGRVEPHEAAALVEASARGAIHDLRRLRGRTAYPSEAQAAEVRLREELADSGTLELSLHGITPADGAVRVRFVESGSRREHAVVVQREPLAAVPQSCGAKPKAGQRLIPLLVRD